MTKKILMLHGYAQSDSIFYAKTGGFRKNLAKLGYELCYPCAPIKIKGADIRDIGDIASTFNTNSGTDEIYGWWAKTVNDQYKISPETLEFLKDYVLKNGPFEGLIGFSQGAGFGGYLCTNFNELLDFTKEQQPDLKFFISFSGFRLYPEWFQEQYEKYPITLPSLHVQGELDTVVEESRVMRLYNACESQSRTMLKHPGGHFVPNSKGFVTKVINWLQAVDRGSGTEVEKEEKCADLSTPQIDSDLLDIIDGMGKI